MSDADIAAIMFNNPTSLPPSDAARTAEAIPASTDVALAGTGGDASDAAPSALYDADAHAKAVEAVTATFEIPEAVQALRKGERFDAALRYEFSLRMVSPTRDAFQAMLAGMPLDPESLYRQIGQLIAEMPDLTSGNAITADVHRWLGRAAVLVEQSGVGLADTINFRMHCDRLAEDVLRDNSPYAMTTILHRALACAELNAPAGAQGAFIAVGAEFGIPQTIGKVVNEAKKDVLFVDAYMNHTVLTDFALLAAEGIGIRVLSDVFYTKPAILQAPSARWIQQYGG